MLVLNNLPNVQILNGKSTKDEEEDEEEEERESNEESENMEKNKNNHFFPKLEEIEEDKNMENNSNYVSNENNNLNNLKDVITSSKDKTNGNNCNSNSYNKGNNNIPKLNLNEKKDINNDTEGKTNSLLYDKIISNREKNIKRETFSDLKNDSNKINNGNYIIDITKEELNLLKDEKYDRNYDFINFLKEFCDIFNNEEKDEENKIINIYLNKVKEVENKKDNIPNYYYFHLLQNKKMKILKTILDEFFPYILNKCPEINKNNILIKLNNEFLNSIKVTKDLIATLHMHIEAYNNKKDAINSNRDINEIIKEKNNIIANLESQREKIFKTIN